MKIMIIISSIFFCQITLAQFDVKEPCFKGIEGAYVLCHYLDTPIILSKSKYDRRVLKSGTVCLEKGRGGKLALKDVQEIEESSSPDSTYTEKYAQYVFVWDNNPKDHESRNDILLIEKAPMLALGGTRSTTFKLDKETMEGSIKMKFWYGGRFLSRPYSNKKFRLQCEYINQ